LGWRRGRLPKLPLPLFPRRRREKQGIEARKLQRPYPRLLKRHLLAIRFLVGLAEALHFLVREDHVVTVPPRGDDRNRPGWDRDMGDAGKRRRRQVYLVIISPSDYRTNFKAFAMHLLLH